MKRKLITLATLLMALFCVSGMVANAEDTTPTLPDITAEETIPETSESPEAPKQEEVIPEDTEIELPESNKEAEGEVLNGIDALWAWAKPYVVGVLGFSIGGVSVGFILYVIFKALTKKFTANYETAKIAKAFAKEIGQQDISVDVSAVVDTKVESIRKELKSDIQPLIDNFGSVQNAVAYLCAAVSNSKIVPAELQAELSEQAKHLNSAAISKKKEVVKLQLAKAPTVEKEKTDNTLFGGYHENA